MKRFKKAPASTTCLAGTSFPALGEIETISLSDVALESLLEEEKTLNKVLEKSRMESRSATGATAVRIDILKKEVKKLKTKEREDAIKSAKRKATELVLTTKVAATHAKKLSILGNELN
jgi:hypothetical protein